MKRDLSIDLPFNNSAAPGFAAQQRASPQVYANSA